MLLLGLVLIADAPGRLPHGAAAAGGAGRRWRPGGVVAAVDRGVASRGAAGAAQRAEGRPPAARGPASHDRGGRLGERQPKGLVMLHLLTLAVVNPGQGVAPPGAGKLTTILQWTAWGVFALCVGGVLISAAKLAHSHNQGYGGAQPAHHQPRVDARRVRDRRVLRRDRRSAQLSRPDEGAMSDQIRPARGPAGALAVEPAERAALRRVPARARRCSASCVAATGGGERPAAREHTPARPLPPAPPRAAHRRRRAAARLPAGSQTIPCEQPAAGAVGDGRVDAGPAEPGRVRAAALRAGRGRRASRTIRPARCWPR